VREHRSKTSSYCRPQGAGDKKSKDKDKKSKDSKDKDKAVKQPVEVRCLG